MKYVTYASIPAVALLLFLGAWLSVDRAGAKGGSAIAFTPDSGSIDEAVTVWSNAWPADTDVALYAAFSPDVYAGYSLPDVEFVRFAATRSDEEGHWEVDVGPDVTRGFNTTGEPGYLIVRAESEGLPPYLQGSTTGHFIVTEDGRRPAGSGEIKLSITLKNGASLPAAVFGWRSAGEDWFFSPYSIIPIPFETTLSGLSDGEWEIVAITPAGSEPVGEDAYDLSNAKLCFNPSCVAGTPVVDVHRARVVEIRDAGVEEVTVELGQPDTSASQPPALATRPTTAGKRNLIGGASALGGILIVGVTALGLRRAAS